MADTQIRSADLLVKSALASPQTMQDLKTQPEETLKRLGAQAVSDLPRVGAPTPKATDKIWLLIVGSFAVVMLGAAAVLGIGVFSQVTDAAKQITKSGHDPHRVHDRRRILGGLACSEPDGVQAGPELTPVSCREPFYPREH